MDLFDRKILDVFPGRCVRKDLPTLMKRGINVPSYVIEFLLGMYCSTDDETIIKAGFEKIRKILTDYYVMPEESEYIKSLIRQNKEKTLIDKITVRYDESKDSYFASFKNFRTKELKVDPSFVVNNPKLLIGGVWCLVSVVYEQEIKKAETTVENLFSNVKVKSKDFSSDEHFFAISTLRPIQISNFNLDEFISKRSEFSTGEWIDLLIRSMGYCPDKLTEKQKLHYLLRLVPLIQKNYYLVELGPRGTGKSHIYSEISANSILLSGSYTTPSNLFYNIHNKQMGLVGYWDCIAFDEISGMSNKGTSSDLIEIMKNYMANGSFARGKYSNNATASFAFLGNTINSVEEMLKNSTLFESFPSFVNNDSAFFDRVSAYLPGWETPKLSMDLLNTDFALNTEYLSEFCHNMRKYDYSSLLSKYFKLNRDVNIRDEIAIKSTFSGLAKLIFPDKKMTKEESKELLSYAIECRRRVKEQLNKMTPLEFKAINLGYIDNDNDECHIINVPEKINSSIVNQGFEIPGYVYAIGKSKNNFIGVYKLENRLIDGKGNLLSKNIEGLNKDDDSLTSINAAFNYFKNNASSITNLNPNEYDYSLYFNDLEGMGPSIDISIAEVVGLFSALIGKPVMPSLVIAGRVMMSGSIKVIDADINAMLDVCEKSGAKNILLPRKSCDASSIDSKQFNKIKLMYYDTPLEAVLRALGL